MAEEVLAGTMRGKEIRRTLTRIEQMLSHEPPIKRYDAATGEALAFGPSYEDLGDYVPFLSHYGKTGRADTEIGKALDHLHRTGYRYRRGGSLIGLLSRGYDYSDMLFGLLLEARRKPSYAREAERCLAAWERFFFPGKPRMAALLLLPGTGIPLPPVLSLPLLSAEDHGMFIELSCMLHELDGKARWLRLAERLSETLFRTEEFRTRRYFPFYAGRSAAGRAIARLPPFSRRRGEFQLLKQNSNTLFGLFALRRRLTGRRKRALERRIRETLDRWLADYLDPETGAFLTNYRHTTGERGADLTCFHMIDLLVEGASSLKERRYAEAATRIADGFLRHQSARTGLLPFLNPDAPQQLRRFGIGPQDSWLDAEVDFCVSLHRLARLTGEGRYRRAAARIADGIVRHHMTGHGFRACVDIREGKPLNGRYSVKMTALVLKAFIAEREWKSINNRRSSHYYLLQDR